MNVENPDLTIPHRGAREAWAFEFGGSYEELENLSLEMIADALGLWGPVSDEHMDRLDPAVLSQIGFATYLTESCGFDVDESMASRFETMSFPVLMVYADGLGDSERIFAPEPPFSFIGKFTDPATIPSFEPIESESAKGQLPQGKAPMTDARMSGMVATVVLIFLALFVALFVWIA